MAAQDPEDPPPGVRNLPRGAYQAAKRALLHRIERARLLERDAADLRAAQARHATTTPSGKAP